MIVIRPAISTFLAATALMMLICCGISGIWLAVEQDSAETWVRHTFAVESRLSEAQIAVMRAEINRLSYVMTGHAEAVSLFERFRSEFPQPMAQLLVLTEDSPVQHRRAVALGNVVADRMVEMQDTIRLYREGHQTQARAIVGGPRSHAARASIIYLIDAIRSTEVGLMQARMRRAASLETAARLTLIVTALLVVLLSGAAWRERKRQLRALRDANAKLAADVRFREEAEARLALLADNATDAVLRIDRQGQCLYASPSVRDILGYAPEHLIGRRVLTRFHPEDAEAVLAAHQRLVDGEAERAEICYRAEHPLRPDSWMWLEAHSGLVRDPVDGRPLEIIASLRDVTARKHLEIALDTARTRAEAAAEAKSNFLANMSHEIRTPMNGVVGFAELLLSSDLSTSQRQQAELIAESGRAMMRLLNDILDLSKVEAGQMKVAEEPFDLRHTLKGCLKLIGPAVAQKSLVIACELGDDLPDRVVGDGLKLRQIVLNLLGNAAKFTAEGSITLRARWIGGQNPPQLCIEVEDTGIGIAVDRHLAVFEHFVQAEPGVAGRFGGTGLGLAISAHLARLLGGDLSLASEPGSGSRFTLTLPLTMAGTDTVPAQAADDVVPARMPQGDVRVLAAEDHGINQMLIRAMLNQLGCRVDVAQDGVEAVAMVSAAQAAADPYRMVFMDMQMPNMGGLEATHRIRAAGHDAEMLPIVALTANAYADDIAACLNAGMQAHTAKPIQMIELQAMLHRFAPAAMQTAGRTIDPAAAARR